MASSSGSGSGSEQSSSPDPSSVLCDKCKKSVLDPSQNNTESIAVTERVQQAVKDWLLTPQIWPVGYLMASPYSPLHVEQQLPGRDWRNAFEDLLALESGNDMISHESRKQEKATAARLSWESANDSIEKMNKFNLHDAPIINAVQEILSSWKSGKRRGPSPSGISQVEKSVEEHKKVMRRRVAYAHWFKAREEERREWSASRHKEPGQWIASLITSGALRGWTSLLSDSEDGDLYNFRGVWDGISVSERELTDHFRAGKPLHSETPGAPWYKVSRRRPATPAYHPQILDEDSFPEPPEPEPDEPTVWSKVPERPCFRRQEMAAERITLPNGKTATRVVMKKWLTNGDLEEKVMIEEPGKVLQEVEKARASIRNRKLG